MTKSEVGKIIFVLKIAYPSHYSKMTVQEYEGLVAVWKRMLGDYEYKQVDKAVDAYIKSDTKGFPPAIGQIIDYIAKTSLPQQETALEAWAKVYKAICNSTYNAEAEFNKLSPAAQKAIGSPSNLREMAAMDIDTVNSVEQSHFIRAYDVQCKREIEQLKISGFKPDQMLENHNQKYIGEVD